MIDPDRYGGRKINVNYTTTFAGKNRRLLLCT